MKGQAALHKQLEAIPAALLAELRIVLEREAENLVQEMRRLVPVESGILQESIGWTWGEAPAGRIKIGSVGGKRFGTLSISIYAGAKNGDDDAFYSYFVEFGTTSATAQPFFFPVYRANRKRIRANLKRGISRVMKEKRK